MAPLASMTQTTDISLKRTGFPFKAIGFSLIGFSLKEDAQYEC
jgi:hypothetical protein